ncbi:hypothetical protein DEM34_01415 [Spiribacter halobius]|uniref:Uncharacterized protein n=1 Tax=Sediminicurvatus halobius TaxID=2182432 RepID=A0A2U2N8Z5_9GAMM|nr:hypothetical protein DEM34_01415 [Spiribacter halobius]
MLGCRDPAFILGYLARCARRGTHLLAFWCEPEGGAPVQQVVAALAGESLPRLYRYRADGGQTPGSETDSLTILAARDFALLPAAAQGMALELLDSTGPEELAARSRRAWDQGLAVDESLWQQLRSLAARTLVASTEDSRARGAGEGAAR